MEEHMPTLHPCNQSVPKWLPSLQFPRVKFKVEKRMTAIPNIDGMEDGMCDKVIYYQINSYDIDVSLLSSGSHWGPKRHSEQN